MKYLNKTIEYELYLLAFVLPLGTRWIIRAGELEYTAYSLYGTDVLLGLVLLLFIVYKFSIFNFQFSKNFQFYNFQTYLIICLLAVAGLSTVFAINKPLALYKFGWLALGAGLFWLIVKADYSRVKLIWSLLVGLALESLLAIWQFLAQQTLASKWLGMSLHRASDLGASVIETVAADGVGERWLRAYGGFDHPNVLGGVMAIGVLLLIGEYLKYPISNIQFPINFQIPNPKSPNIFKIIYWLFIVLFTAGLFFSFSRGAWLALGAGLAVLLAGAVMKKNLAAQKNILQTVLISGLVFFILFFQFPNLVMTRLYGGGRLENKSVSERLESIKNSLPIIKKNWAIGAGIGNYTLALERELSGRESYFYQPAHDVFLLVFSEIGIFGFILFISLILYLIIFNFQVPIFKQFSMNKFSNNSLKIVNCKLKIGENQYGTNWIINRSILAALVILFSLDHWLWSLHFGVLFFWLAMGLVIKKEKSSGLLLGADLGAERENRVPARE